MNRLLHKTSHTILKLKMPREKSKKSSQLKKVKISDSSEKPFECDICHKRYCHRQSLSTHKWIHTHNNRYKCNICDKEFYNSGHLRQHKRIHTGEMPCECSFCGKKFTQRSYLKTHERIHTGKKPFECKLCDKTFRQKSHLKNHERIHNQLPKLKCTWNDCIAEFNHHQSRIRHIRAHHDPTPYHCDKCDRKYKLKRDLDHHKRKHQIMKTRKLDKK